MNSIQFGQYHAYNDLGLILKKKEIGSPEPKKMQIEVEGRDGVLDYTEYFGDIKYNNRVLKFDFVMLQSPFLSAYSTINDALHGKVVRITLDEDSSYYYLGRLSVSPFTNDKNIGSISIECDCEPYKYKQNETTVTRAVSGSDTIILTNSRKRVVPLITTTASMTIGFNGNTYNVEAGTFTIPELELVEGSNTVTVTGTGNITFKYQEGRL